MRHDRLRRIVGIAACTLGTAVPSAAGATDVVFDFSAPGTDQMGSYASSPGAVVAMGVGTLRLRGMPSWLSPAQQARISVTVHNAGAPIADRPVRIVLDASGSAFLHFARNDGEDIEVTDAVGHVMSSWVEGADTPELHAAIWVRLPMLPTGNTQLFLYAGSGVSPSVDNGVTFFSYASPVTWEYAGDTVAPTATLDAVGFSAINAYVVGMATGMLASTMPTTFMAGTVVPESAIQTAGPASFEFETGGDAAMPVALLGTDFIAPAPRCSDVFTIVAPVADADVTISDGATMVAMQHVAVGTSSTVPADVADMHAIVVHSSAPVLVHHNGGACDIYDMQPQSTDLFGANGGTGLVAAAMTAHVTAYYSDGTTGMITVPAGTAVALACSGIEGSGCAVHLESDVPIGAISYADGDGGDAEAYLDRSSLGRNFAIARPSQYLHIAASEPDTNCTLTLPSGTTSVQNGGTLPPPYANNIFFGGMDNVVHVPAGSSVQCTHPSWLVLEDGGDENEKNVWPEQFHRAYDAAPPTAMFGTVQTRFGAGQDEWVSTPSYIAPRRLIGWLGFDDTNVTLPDNTHVAYQISTDMGMSWQYVSNDHWTPAPSATIQYASTGGDIDSAMPSLPTGPLSIRAIMRSDDGVSAPVIDSLRVGAELAGTYAGIVLDPVPSPQQTSTSFDIRAVAVDSTGMTDVSITGPAQVESDAGPVTAVGVPQFVQGVLTGRISIAGVSSAAHVVVVMSGMTGVSNPFALVAGTASQLVMVSGDGQFGTVGTALHSPLVVRAMSATSAPVPGVMIGFASLMGGGSVSPAAMYTDSNGFAATVLTLGAMPGANQVSATASGVMTPVMFTARADAVGAEPPPATVDGGTGTTGSSGGCGCRAPAGRPGRSAVALLALGALLGRRRRTRRHTAA